MSRRNEPVASVKELLFLILIVLLISLVMQTCGCASVPNHVAIYQVKPYTIVSANPRYIQKMYDRFCPDEKRNEWGFYEPATRTIYVVGERWDRSMPKAYELGHEVWHLRELGGWWHR